MKKILIYSPYSEWYLHSYYDITVAKGLVERGHQVKIVCCNATFSDCDQHWAASSPRGEQSCNSCMGMSESIYNKSNLKFDWLGEFLIEKDFNDIKKWVNSLSTDDLLQAQIDGYSVGKWVSSSVNSHFRIKDLNFLDKTIEDGFRSYLYSGGLACKAAKRIINDFRPDALFTFNGRMFSHRIFLEVAKLNNVRVLTHERGRLDNSLSLFQNESCSSTNTFASTWRKWQMVPLLENQLNAVDKIMFEDREQGKNTGWLSFVQGNESVTIFKEKYGIPFDKKMVSLFPSSDDEVAASDSWKPLMAQIEWIRQVVSIFLKRKNLVLVIRLHPNLSGLTGTNHQFLNEMKLIEASSGSSGNVVFIWPKEKVSSYELINASVANLTFFSTITLESVIRQKPTLICGGGPFYGLGCVTSLKSPELLEESIIQLLDTKVTKEQLCVLYRFSYHYFVRLSKRFSLVEIINVHHARLTYTNVEELYEGKNKSLDSICNFLTKGNDVHLSPSPDKSYAYEKNYENIFLKNKMNSNSRMKSAGHCISVVVTCYNYAKYLKEAVESVIRQTYSNFEIIIVNDGSTDDSQKVAEELINANPDFKIKLINQENSGQPAISRNNGIKCAVGEYILCLDADDKLDRKMLERCAQVLDESPSIGIAYTDRLDFDGVDEIVLAGEYDFNQLKYANHISYCGLYRREVWEDIGGYRENVRGCEDWDFWIAAGCNEYYGKRIPEPLFMYRRHDTGLYQHALANFEEKKAYIILNNRSAYSLNDISKAELYLYSVNKGIANSSSFLSEAERNADLSTEYIQDDRKMELIDMFSDEGVFPLVSVVIPTCNRTASLYKTLLSISSQSYKNWEAIVINDGGESISKRLVTFDSRIKLIELSQNHGQSYARNVALESMLGDVVCFLDDDDAYLPNHLETIVKGLKNADFVYTLAEYIYKDEAGNLIGKEVPYKDMVFSREQLLVENFIPINTWGIRKSKLDEAGFFDEEMSCLEDWELLIRLSSVCNFSHIPVVTAKVNSIQGGESVTNANIKNYAEVFSGVYNRHNDSCSPSLIKAREQRLRTLPKQSRKSIAVILQLYYFDLWPEFELAISSVPQEFDLYVSIPEDSDKSVSLAILKSFPNAKIYELPNKGRGILPFLTIFKEIQPLNYRLVLKLHTKKSPHQIDEYGEKWRKTTLSSLAQWNKRVNDIFDLFESNPTLGIFSPLGHLYPFKSIDANFQTINQLMPGIDRGEFDKKQFKYVNGSMFWFRPEAIDNVLKLNLTADDFEEELGQLDGTLAHAIERLFGVICQTSGYMLTDRMPKRDDVVYQDWLDKKRENDLSRDMLFLSDSSIKQAKIHCLIYVDGDLSLLANTIDSLGGQSYENWHLSVISCLPCPDEMFNEVAQLSWLQIDQQTDVQTILLKLNIVSDWLVFLEVGDYLEPHALSSCIEFSNKRPDFQLIYTDEDRVSPEGFFHSPQFKPSFNLDLLYSTDYIGGLTLFNSASLTQLEQIFFPNAFIAYDLVLHYLDYFGESVIGHVENILLHRQDTLDQYKLAQFEFRQAALANHFQRKNIKVIIGEGFAKGSFDVKYQHETAPKVSIIIPTKDQLALLNACVDSILDKTSYPNYEIIIMDNQSIEAETKNYFEQVTQSNPDKIKVIEYAKPYNFSAINNFAVEQAVGDYLVLLNNDTMVLQTEWLQGMLSQAQRKEVGVVGVKLVFPNKTIQHAGVVLGMGANGVAEHPHIAIPMEVTGYMDRAMLVQDYSAVTAACLMIEKKLYQEVGGLDEDKFKVLYNDVDLCLKVRELDYKIVWTPYVTLIHHGSSSLKKVKQDKKRIEQSQQEIDSMLEKWLPQLANDPAYNRNLSLKNTDFQVDISMNVTWNVDFKDKPRVYAFPANSAGVGEYRVRAPIRGLTQAGMIQSSLANNMDQLIFPTPVEIERIKPDVLLIQNGFLDWMLEPWKKYRQFNDVFMVSGQDDLVYMLPNNHPMKGQWPKNTRRKLKEKFQCSDRVIVANEALAAEFSKLTDDIIVVPNYLEKARWSELAIPEKQIRKKLRVGWAGGQEHIGDLAFILPVVEALHKEVDWVFMGLCPDQLMPFVKEAHHGVEFDLYPQKLANLDLDLAIAPLEHNKFNECKTNLRLLEFGVLAWPIVCSDILPYQSAPVTRVANNVERWIKVLREKIDDPDELRKEGVLLQRWVMENYMLDDHLDEWFAALMP